MLGIRIQRQPVFVSEKDACGPLAALAEVLASATRCGPLWARLRHGLLPFDAGTAELLLSGERFLHADDPGRPTQVLSLCATPDGVGELGVVSVNVRPHAEPGAAPGLLLSAALPDAAFDTDTASLLRLLEGCIGAISADVAFIGPDGWRRELGVGWATFTRTVRHALLPADAVIVPVRSGSLILAHGEEPASESPSARDAVVRVREALRPEPVTEPSREEATAPAMEALAPAPAGPEAGWARWAGAQGVGETEEVSTAAFRRPTLPFIKEAPAADGVQDPNAPRVRPLGEGGGATAEVDIAAFRRPPLPFPEEPQPADHVGELNASGAKPSAERAVAAGHRTMILPVMAPFQETPQVARASATCCKTMPLPVMAPAQDLADGTSDRGTVALQPVLSVVDGGATLSLEQYAALCAELAVFPERPAAVCLRYGLAAAGSRKVLDDEFGQRFRADEAMHQRWQALVVHYSEWYRRQGAVR